MVSTENFDAFGGMETYTRTVAHELDRLGHQTAIYSPRPGAMAALARREGLQVFGRDDLPEHCDAILAQDAATCLELTASYPDAVRLFVAHSRDHVLHEPPQLTGVCDGVVALNDRVGDWVRARAWHPPVTRLRQPVELSRYRDLAQPGSLAKRVLVTTNYVGGARGRMLEEACARAGYDVTWIGTTTEPHASPEDAIGASDIVVGLGRSAVEAMAAGRAVYVFGVLGAGGWITVGSYPDLEADGFAGLSESPAATVEGLAEELAGWEPGMGEANRDLASAHSARTHAVELVQLIRRFGEGRDANADSAGDTCAPAPPAQLEELARLMRLEWRMYDQAMRKSLEADRARAERDRYLTEAEDAIDRVKVLDAELDRAFARVAELEGDVRKLEEGLATRRYRWAQGLAMPLDRLRGRRRATRPPR